MRRRNSRGDERIGFGQAGLHQHVQRGQLHQPGDQAIRPAEPTSRQLRHHQRRDEPP